MLHIELNEHWTIKPATAPPFLVATTTQLDAHKVESKPADDTYMLLNGYP